MSACPNGHEVDDGAPYCDECGARTSGGPVSGAVSPPPRSWLCRPCHTTQSHSRFCEACGEPNPDHPDFVGTDIGSRSYPPVEEDKEADGESAVPVSASGQKVKENTAAWTLTAAADRDYFDRVQGYAGPDASAIQFPVVYPPRRFELTGTQLFIGRRSRSRGIDPDIDLSSAPLDPGVSHSHAAVVATDDGGWAVVDVGSSNGTYLNDSTEPITQGTAYPLADGDRILLGAWTRLTVNRT